MLSDAWSGLRARRSRTLLAALGVLAASLVVGTAATVGYSLATGFDRAATAAGLPDVIARFDPDFRGRVDARVGALPNLEGHSFRNEQTSRFMSAGSHSTGRGAGDSVLGGRRGYLITAGRDLVDGRRGAGGIERGLGPEGDPEAGGTLGTPGPG